MAPAMSPPAIPPSLASPVWGLVPAVPRPAKAEQGRHLQPARGAVILEKNAELKECDFFLIGFIFQNALRNVQQRGV